MRARPVLLLTAAMLLLLSLSPTAFSPTRGAQASHAGGSAECYTGDNPVSDGVISPGEYWESFFDGVTKILAYFHCDNSTERLLHVGLVSPWPGWVGLLVQAAEPMDGYANEVRLAYVPTAGQVQVRDAYRNVSEATATSDIVLGGRGDVENVTTGTANAARIYEFSIPLRSTDPFDSRLESTGPFYFAIEYNEDMVDLNSNATALSASTFVVGGTTAAGSWTTMELSFAPSPETLETPTMLLVLRDAQGYPVASAQLEVFVRTAFGFLEVGPVSTNDQGVAAVTYAPRDEGDYLLGAAYPGGYGLLASVVWRVLHVTSEFAGGRIGVGQVSGGPFDLRPVDALIVVVVLGVWAAYAYAFFVTWISTHRAPALPHDPNVHPFNWRTGK